MLVSPIRVHKLLDGLLGATDAEGPHTALLITPQGQLLAKATVPEDNDDGDEENGDAEGGEENGDAKEEDDLGEEDGDEEDEDDEPYLEGPERLRLLLGLASQWEEDESPRVECELGRLFMCAIPLPEPEVIPPNAALPPVKPAYIPSFLLVLNGSSETPWKELSARADEFLGHWNLLTTTYPPLHNRSP